MNALLIFMVRLIVGIVFGVFICRLFRPEWEMYQGAATGVILVAIVYGIEFFRRNKQSG